MNTNFNLLLEPWLHPVSAHVAAQILLILLLENALLSLLFAVITHALLPERLRKHAVLNVLTLTFLGALLPVLGPFLLLFIGLIYPHLAKGTHRVPPKLLPQPSYAMEMQNHFSQFGVGGALARLRTAALDSEQGSCALLAIGARRNQEATRLLNEALSHPDETLRLLAHHLLEQREKSIVMLMSRLESLLEKKGQNAAVTALDLAELHLEFLYLGLVEGSLQQMHIDAARRLLDSIGEPPVEVTWRPRLLLVRARLKRMGRQNDSEEDISRGHEEALEAGVAPARALPWLLEQSWRERDYQRLRSLLKRHPLHPQIPLVGPVAAFWKQ